MEADQPSTAVCNSAEVRLMHGAAPAAAVEPRVSRGTSVSRPSPCAAHEAVEGLLVRFGAPVTIVEAFSTTPRKKTKNKCSL